jgi:hypothetical protein
VDDIGTVHSVKVRAESLYEATLLGLNALSRVGWEGDGDTFGSVLVEVHYEPTSHEVDVPKFLRWLKQHGIDSNHEKQKQALRDLMK